MSTTTVTVLGCDGSHAGPGGNGSSYLVRDWASGAAVWLDAGPGSFAALQQCIDPMRLTGIVLTHEHSDHWSDLEGFVTAARWTMHYEGPAIEVHAAPGIAERVSQDVEGLLHWCEIGDGATAAFGGLSLRFSRTDHPPATFAVRLQSASGVIGYSADSGPGWALSSLGTDLDLALCEATYTKDFEESGGGHMSGRQAARAAEEAGVRRLVLTHRWAKIPAGAVRAEAAAVFGGPIEQAEVGRGFSL